MEPEMETFKQTTIYFSVATPGKTVVEKARDVIARGFAGARSFGADVEPTDSDRATASWFNVSSHKPGSDPTEVEATVTAPEEIMDAYLEALKAVE